jgi:DNA-binding MarR family transcriptional regulator
MDSANAPTEALIRRIRACFNRLRALADDLHRGLGVTGGMRAVLEALEEGGAQTVPHMARAKSVSRQHIQVLVNALVESRLARVDDNPADRRSPLVSVTRQGRAAFARMRGREKAVLAELAAELAPADLATATATLAALQAGLDARLAQRGAEEDRMAAKPPAARRR